MGYKVGDMVVYPRHGAARVEAITERVVKGPSGLCIFR